MALTLTIGGTNFLPQYQTGSARILEKIANKANTLSLKITKKSGENTPQEGEEIIFKDGSRFLFAGFVSRLEPIEFGEGELVVYSLEATDYTYVLINKNAQKTYESQTLKQIVDDLLSEYVDSGYGLTTTNVENGPTINTISFNHISLRKCFEKLAKVTGYVWWVDYEKDIHFVETTTDLAPEEVRDDSDNFESISIQADVSQVRNSIVVKGGREEVGTNFIQEIQCDGLAREFLLREKPKTMVSIEIDTGGGYSSQTFGVDPLDDEAGNYFMFNFQEKYIRVTPANPVPSATDKIRVTYKYEVPVITQLKDTLSISAMAALEGGDGIHDYSIFEPSIKSKEEARNRALKELAEFSNPLLWGVFETRTGFLQSGSVFAPGQLVTVNLPTWGISSDTKYTVQEVLIWLDEDGSNIEYHYRVTFGGRLLGVREFLEGLAAKEDVILETEEIDRIEAVQETMTIAELIQRNPFLEEISETATIAGVENETIVTPPFKWAPYGVDPDLEAKWGKFEWA